MEEEIRKRVPVECAASAHREAMEPRNVSYNLLLDRRRMGTLDSQTQVWQGAEPNGNADGGDVRQFRREDPLRR